jgi:hypothetical protein
MPEGRQGLIRKIFLSWRYFSDSSGGSPESRIQGIGFSAES